MKKEFTEQEALAKAASYCSLAEHCSTEVVEKLQVWGMTEEATARIMQELINDRFVDDVRFCVAYTRDKYRFAQWGRNKIRQNLRMKGMDTDQITKGMESIDESEYIALLADLLKRKRKTIKARNDYELDGKLARFALSRGFEPNYVFKLLKNVDESLDYTD